ncbi:unnamed protein product [Ilex paraguariensis]|uniref:DUF3741 domain-containing protein n=1 Tax=Ilex paraguariensis TaxID=185542 RepID=A0ABC8V3T3_9AQUA
MEVEKRGSKGGFLQLFDWNAKSCRKLFSNKSELPEGSKHGKENFDSLGISRLQQVHENGLGLTIKGSSDYRCASSVCGDEGCGARAPGVVARLMGLDSLPSSNVSESSFAPFFDSGSFRGSLTAKVTTDFRSEHHIVDYGNIRDKLDGFSRNPVELQLQKLQNRPIERFQTEILPPKSAKSIPITHHKLLSPIKSPGFIPTKNAAYIMEAAAKIIEQSPRSTINGKFPSFRSSSVPLKIRDLKEKIEAAQKTSRLPEASQRPKEHRSVKYMKRHPSDSSCSGSEGKKLTKASVVSERGSSASLKKKGKPVSLAVQAKVNVQRRDGLNYKGHRSSVNQKEDKEVKSGHDGNNQPYMQQSMRKKASIGRSSDVLRQNNQKQNCASNKGRVSSKPSVPRHEDIKTLSMNCSSRSTETVNEVVVDAVVVPRKMNLVTADTIKELSSSKTRSYSGKKRPIIGDIQFDDCAVDTVQVNKNERPVKCNVTMDGGTQWDPIAAKKGSDVVSFTFTSPIKKSVPGPQASGQVTGKNKNLCLSYYDNQSDSKSSTLSSLGLNVIGGDALSVLLEQKLKELACRVESSHYDLLKEGSASSATSSYQDSVSTPSVANTMPMEHDKRYQLRLHEDKPDIQDDFDCSLVDELQVKAKQKWLVCLHLLYFSTSITVLSYMAFSYAE